MNNREKYNVRSLPEKGHFYSSFNMEDATDVVYKHARKCIKII